MKCKTSDDIYNTLFSQEFETWHNKTFIEHVETNSPSKQQILEDIKKLFNLDT